uniref:Uncharacterized protein n=1 Tax=Oryza brachyantha TaxID=4533 RepID=J3ME80_ORYBR
MSHQSESPLPCGSSPPHDSVDEVSSIDPMDLYTMEEFLLEQEILKDFSDHLVDETMGDVEALQDQISNTIPGTRRYVVRPREEAKQQLMDDYFSLNPIYDDKFFRRRFRMRRSLFLRIVDALSG